MKNLLAAILAVAFVLLAPSVSARNTQMQPPSTIDLNDRNGRPLDESATAAAIRAGAAAVAQRWEIINEQPGRIELRAVVREKHTVVMAAVYTAGHVTFEYVSSVNMDHKVRRDRGELIHPNYMQWRMLLENAVRADAATR